MAKESDALVFKALGEKTRLDILEVLLKKEMCASDLLNEINISQSTLSYHMDILINSRVVSVRSDGKWKYYSINKETIAVTKLRLDKLLKNTNMNTIVPEKSYR